MEYLPLTKNVDGSMGVDLSDLENLKTVSASVECVARYCKRKNRELRVKVPWKGSEKLLAALIQAGFTIHQVEATDMMLVQDLLVHVQPEQDVTIEQELPHSIPEPGAVRTPEIKQHPSSADCLEEPGDEPDSASEATDEEVMSGESGASVESHTEIASADSHSPRIESSRKRSSASAFDEDSLFAKIRPFLNQQIEEALLPLISALRSREEDEHKHRQKMLALEQEKLALMRQKLEYTRRSNAVRASVAKLRKPPSVNFAFCN